MNKLISQTAIIILILMASMVSQCKEKKPSDSSVNSYTELQKLWIDPPAEYRSAPLWDWNDHISEKEIALQMEEFKSAGIGGVFVHPRPGLITDYLSDEWSRLFDYTVKKGKELGMNVWIYDENSYPSGFAGGHVPVEMPDSYQQGTGLSYIVQEKLDVTGTDKYEVILRETESGFENISAIYQQLNGEKGMFYLFKRSYPQNSPWTGGGPYVDLLYPGVTEKFLEITMKSYEKYNKADFGGTVKGIFTDEPNLNAAISEGTALRWTPALWDLFKKRWGYDLKTNLPSLIDEVGDWKKVRHDYYVLLLELFIDRWAKPYSAYCENNNLLLTGHYWEHGWPYPTEGFDEAAFYIWHQQPAVDMLGNQLDPNGLGGQFGNTRAIRELRSAANQAGRQRTLSETYGGGGYEMDFKAFKRLADWQCVFGVNFVNQHLSYFSMEGVRKFDYPPTFSYQEPWWEDYKVMGDYLARISMATAAGEQINKTLVLQPNTSAWMYYSRVVRNQQIDSIQHDFKYFVHQLEQQHFEYDLGSEKVLRDIGSVSKGKLIVGKRSYSLVVIPKEMENIDRYTYELLDKYLSDGGEILAFRNESERLDGEVSSKVAELKARYSDQWRTATSVEDDWVRELMKPDEFAIRDKAENREFFHQRRILNDGQILYLINSSESEIAVADIVAAGKSVIQIDLFTGEQNLVSTEKSADGISFEVNLSPIGSALYFISDKAENFPGLEKTGFKETGNVETSGSMEAIRLSDNILTIDYLDIKTSKTEKQNVYFMNAAWGLFHENGVEVGNPWQEKIQYRQKYVAMDTLFTADSAFEVNYHFKISDNVSDDVMTELKAVVEHPELWSVSINGTPVYPEPGKFWIDHHFPVFMIGDYVKKGENSITLIAPRFSIFAEVMPIYILGNFALNPLTSGFGIGNTKPIGTSDWISAGMPFYSQKVAYLQKFNGRKGGKFAVSLGKWNGTVCEVFVNGKKAGIIAFPPYQLDISNSVNEGENIVEVRVTGSLKNTFGYFYRSNKNWIHWPGAWNSAPEIRPSLESMFLVNYGLFEPFRIMNLIHN